MDIMVALVAAWGMVTIVYLGLVLYRSRITRRETDWIPLSDDAREEKAIEAQKVTEMKSHKLDLPIRVLGIVWVILVLAIGGYWFYHGLTTQPPVTP
jgi:uncharacterized ion transporter superfamily protein YfcC